MLSPGMSILTSAMVMMSGLRYENSESNSAEEDRSFIDFCLTDYEIRKIVGGSYTMMVDECEKSRECLWMSMFFAYNSSCSNPIDGAISFMEGEDEILQVEPSNGSLCIVLPNQSSRRFTRYVKHSQLPPRKKDQSEELLYYQICARYIPTTEQF
ncbi:hypothetical protein ACOME3_006809 [Neoechinorhynchus agilis]